LSPPLVVGAAAGKLSLLSRLSSGTRARARSCVRTPSQAIMPDPQKIPPTLAPEAGPKLSPTRDEKPAEGASPSAAAGSDPGPLETRSDSVLRLRDTEGGTGSPPRSCVPGERIGPYEVSGEIGRGGMGAVLRGRDPNLGRDL